MNLKTVWQVGTSLLRNIRIKLMRGKDYQCRWLYSCPVGTILRIHKGGFLKIGRHLASGKGLHLSVLPGAKMELGDDISINSDCTVIARKHIKIGNDVLIGPGCRIYDHDHDYRKTGRERRNSFLCDTVEIGNGVWFGANCIVLKGTKIGDNCVFGAGSIIKGEYPADTIVIQERTERQKKIDIEQKKELR